jgi:uncharacterized membrane protein YraQ (UPF0718 family)
MKIVFSENLKQEETSNVMMMEEDGERTDAQLSVFFLLLVIIMITSTGVIDSPVQYAAQRLGISGNIMPRLLCILGELLLLALVMRKWFYRSEVILWLKKSKDLFWLIFPKVLGGIFLCGIIAVAFPLTSFMAFFDSNSIEGNFVASVLGSLMYFGTIVGVTIVSTLKDFGMHPGPAMTLLLSAPAVSLPSVLALVPIVGAKKSAFFLILVIVFSAFSGLIFGATF